MADLHWKWRQWARSAVSVGGLWLIVADINGVVVLAMLSLMGAASAAQDTASDLPTGGIATNSSGVFRIHTFTNANATFTVPVDLTNQVSLLLVAGGGGGGHTEGGGGGGGGLICTNSVTVTAGTYTVTIGAGGAGDTSGSPPNCGANGSDSTFSTYTAVGGGGGGSRTNGYANPGQHGGSGGGGAETDKGLTNAIYGGTGTPGQGFGGGQGSSLSGMTGGGGGGAAAAGMNAPAGLIYVGATGGVGRAFSFIAGITNYYAGGGGGGCWKGLIAPGGLGGGGNGGISNTAGVAGSPSTGGGGGGGAYDNPNGGNGGSGIFIISYATNLASASSTSLSVDNASGASGVTSNSATLNGMLSSTGSSVTVVGMYWGPTDGGTNVTSWTNVTQFVIRPVGLFSTNIAGLASNMTYYYRCYASNSAGFVVWAPSTTNFATLGPTFTLSVVSVGAASPAPGLYTNMLGAVLTNWVVSPDNHATTQYVCTGWTMTGDDPQAGSTTNFVMIQTNNAVLTWLWPTTNYWLSVQTIGNGVILGVTNGWYPNGTDFLLTAVPMPHYNFVNWTGTGLTGSDTDLTMSVTMDQSRSITANFAIDQFKLVVVSEQGACVPAPGTNTLNYGARSCFVTNSPKVLSGSTQYVCTGWTGTGNVTNGVGTNTAFVLDTDSSITWLWTATNYWFSIQTNGNGTVTGATNGWYTNGTSFLLTAAPSPFWNLINWTGTGLSGADTNLTLPLVMGQARRTITANFATNGPNIISIIAYAPLNGTTNVSLPPVLSVTASNLHAHTMTITYYGREIPPPGPDFTVAVLPDTQNYTTNGGNGIFQQQVNWIVANRVRSNIVFVAQEGDLVNSVTDSSQWSVATNAMYRLEDTNLTHLSEGIPYGIAVGTHERNGTDTSTFNLHFGTNHFKGRSYDGGHYGSNRDNHYELFSVGGLDFLVLSIADGAASAVNTWADGVLKANPSRRAIVVTHAGLDLAGHFTAQGQSIYDTLKGNTNWFMMLSGDARGEARRQDTYNSNTVYSILADYQDFPNGGNGWLRLMMFSPSNDTIKVGTYSPYLNQQNPTTNSSFALPYDMQNTGGVFTVLGSISGVVNMQQASFEWSTLKTATEFEWYATASDGIATTTGAVCRFLTTDLIDPFQHYEQIRVAHSNDDAIQTSAGGGSGVSLDDQTLPLGRKEIPGPWYTGLRFTGIALEKNAIVTNAYIQFMGANETFSNTAVVIMGQRTNNAAAFVAATRNISQRSNTAARVTWELNQWWGPTNFPGASQRTPNLAGIVNEIVAQSNWVAGNSIVFIMTNRFFANNTLRMAYSYDGDPSNAPMFCYSTARETHWLGVLTSGSGAVTGATNGWYTNGTSFLLNAVPSPFWNLINWTGTGLSGLDTNLTLSVTMNQAKLITANFAVDQHTLTTSSAHGGASQVTTTAEWGTSLSCYLTNSFVQNGNTQYVANGGMVLGNDFIQVNTTNITLALTNDANLTWTWATNFWLATAASGPGTVSVESQWCPSGANVTIVATGLAPFHFASWSGGTNGCTAVGNVLWADMTQARSVTANFVIDQKTLTVNSEHVGASPGTTTVDWGTTKPFYLTNSPVLNGTTQYLANGGVVVGNSYSQNGFTNVSLTLTNDATLTWNWRTQYMFGALSSGNGGVGGESNGWKDHGSNVSVIAVPAIYYHFGYWGGDTNDCLTNSDQLTAPMTIARQIFANFAMNLATNDTPLWWLAQYGLSTNDSGALYDDGDGMPAWEEYIAGTDPTNPLSLLSVTNVTIDESGVWVYWQGGSAVTQYLEMRRDLMSTTEQWAAVFTNIPPTPTDTNYIDSSTDVGRFYRIRAVR